MDDAFVRACAWAGRWRRRDCLREDRDGGDRPSQLVSALELARLAATPAEVRALAVLTASLVATASSVGLVFAVFFLGDAVLPLVPALVASPVLAALVILYYPRALAERLRLAAIGEAPRAVTYLTMSLQVRPALERAIAFAAEHVAGPFAERLRGALWDVHLRARVRIEDGFLAIAGQGEPWNEDLKRALYLIAHATREGSPEGLARSLDRARSLVFEGARRRLQGYAVGLRGPTTALFALGVLLPLVLGSLMPLLSTGSFAPVAIDVVEPRAGNPLPWILLLDVAFPLVTFAVAHHVSSRRPGISPNSRRVPVRRSHVVLAVPLLAISVFLMMSPETRLLSLGTLVLAFAVPALLAVRVPVRETRRSEALEREFPDALFELGSRLEEGRGLEDSFAAVSRSLRGTDSGFLFDRIVHAIRYGGSADSAMQRESHTVRASLELVVDLARKDPQVAGRATLEMSNHLRELRGVEDDMRAALRPTVDAMKATALVFAPLVLGVTGGLHRLLADAFATFAPTPLDPTAFQLALGVYVLLTASAIVYFVVRIEAGDRAMLAISLARTLPVAYAVFVATAFFADFAL